MTTPQSSGKRVSVSAVASTNAGTADGDGKKRRKQISQTDIPSFTLSEAERVPRALADQYAGSSVTPLELALALKLQPQSSNFRMLAGASMAYGLTDGSAWAETIGLAPLGRRIVRPTAEGDDEAARRDALLKPRIIKEFLTNYNGGKVPRDDIAHNVLETMGVPPQETKRVFTQILADARTLGLLANINGIEYVQLTRSATVAGAARPPAKSIEDLGEIFESDGADDAETTHAPMAGARDQIAAAKPASAAPEEVKRIYITHGSNKGFVELLKKVLKIVDVEAIVSTDRETASIPVPAKVIGDMRLCGASIIHVDAERTLKDESDADVVTLNENVLIEIGAAMALYGERFILLVKDGVKLPSNLQGLYQVRYKGDKLDGDEAMRLLEAVADIKTRKLPGA